MKTIQELEKKTIDEITNLKNKVVKTPFFLRFLNALRIGKNIVVNVAKYTLVSVISFLAVNIILLQFSFYQTLLIKSLFEYASGKIRYRLDFSSVYIDFIHSHIEFKDLEIENKDKEEKMVFAGRLFVDIDVADVVKEGDITLLNVILENGNVALILDKETGEMNMIEFVDQLEAMFDSGKPKDPNKKPTRFTIKKAKLHNTEFSYDDLRKKEAQEGFDPAHIHLHKINADIRNLITVADTVQIKVNKLSTADKKINLDLKNITTLFRMTRQSMGFYNLHLFLNNTIIKDHLVMEFDKISDMSDFVNKVRINANLDNSRIDTEDLALFAPELKKYKDIWKITGNFIGTVSEFDFKKMNLELGKSTHLVGKIYMKGLPDIDKTFLDVNLDPSSQVSSADLSKFIPDEQVNKMLGNFGLIKLDAKFIGYVNDFDLKGNFKTEAGDFNPDLHLNLIDQSYTANLNTQSLDLGKILGLNQIGKMTIEGDIKGRGFDINANLTLNLLVKNLEYNAYPYQNIHIDATLGKQNFNGIFKSTDPNLDMDVNGVIDLNKNAENPKMPPGKFNFDADIRNVDLNALHFSDVPLQFKGNIQANMNGLELDSLLGNVAMKNVFVKYTDKELKIKNIVLNALRSELFKSYQLRSDFVDFLIKGNFTINDFINDLPALAQEYILAIQNKNEEISHYYGQKKERHSKENIKPYKANYNLELKNINPVVNLFAKDFFISRNESFYGEIKEDSVSVVSLFTADNNEIDTLVFQKNTLHDINLDVYAAKRTDTSKVENVKINVFSTKQQFGTFKSEGLRVRANWVADHIKFEGRFQQDDSIGNYVDLLGNIEIDKNNLVLNFEPSHFRFLNKKWEISPYNEIFINDDYIEINNLSFHSKDDPNSQFIIDGVLSDKIKAPILLSIQNVELYQFSNFLGRKMSGIINGNLRAKNIYTEPIVKGNVSIDNFTMIGAKEEILMGDLFVKTSWDNAVERLQIDGELWQRNKQMMLVYGEIDPDSTESLRLKVDLRGTALKIIEPFTEGILDKYSGVAKGKLTIGGSFSTPRVEGKINLVNGAFRVKYLNTFYKIRNDDVFPAIIHLDAKSIRFKNLIMRDEENDELKVKANIEHNGFKDIQLIVEGIYKKFKFLSKPESEGDVFYGRAEATGTLKVTGTPEQLNINVDATNEKYTRIYLPLDGYADAQKSDFIVFVKPKNKLDTTTNKTPKKVDLSSLKLALNLNINPEAKIEIEFDKRAGDIIRAEGNGNIHMDVDTKGDFAITGDYTITKGKYNFTLLNLVNKGFDIKPGSRLTFTGDVLQTFVNITALYPQMVSLEPLIDLTTVPDPQNPQYKEKAQVSVMLGMEGQLMSPEIKLGVDLSKAKNVSNSDLRNEVANLETRLSNEDQERNRQVFSLLVLKRLSPPNSFSGIGAATTSSLSELLSNQLNAWVSQADEKLEINLNLDNSSLRVGYRLLDDRLRITREGSFSGSQTNSTASVIGDWTIEYLLTVDGKLRAKAYNRTNQSALNNAINLNNAATTTAGFSLLYTQSFNGFKDLFKVKFKEEKQNAEVENVDIDNQLNKDVIDPDHPENNKKNKRKRKKDIKKEQMEKTDPKNLAQ